MRPLLWLLELPRISEKDEALRTLGDSDHIRERHLSRLVDEEHVHRLESFRSSPEPGRSANDLRASIAEPLERFIVLSGLLDERRFLALVGHLRKATDPSLFGCAVISLRESIDLTTPTGRLLDCW